LFLLTALENKIDKINQSRNYKIVSVYKPDVLKQYELLFKDCKLKFKRIKQSKKGEYITGTWMVQGMEKHHTFFIEKILSDPSVSEFEF